MSECGYTERGRACHEPGIHEVQFDGRKLRLCDRHSRPEFHPPDLRKKLPGRVQPAVDVLRAAAP